MDKNLKNRIIHSARSVIRRRYSLLEVPRRGIHNAIAAAMPIFNNTPYSVLLHHSLPLVAREQIGVAFSNKVVDTRLPQPAGCGNKYDVDSKVQYGRSMIEMLGVLAIIGVLSVGGLASYSKAMEMWKINKAKAEYSYYIFGMLKYREEGKKLTQEGTSNQIILTDIAEAEGLVPPNWKKYGVQGQYMHIDSLGNLVYVFSRNGHLSFSISMTKIREGKVVSTQNLRQLCSNLMLDIIQPLHSVVYNVFVEAPRSYWGDSYCTNGAWCLKDMKVADVQNICNLCVDGGCYFILSF